MKILHLLSSRKWTGAAEPVFQLCRELIRRGHEVDLAYSQPLPGKRLSSRNLREGKLNLWVEPSRSLYRPAMKQKAEEMGIPVLEALRLNVAANLRDNWNDYFLLRKIFREGRYDIVHCHLGHALFLALLSRGKSGSGPRLVYTHHPAKPLRSGPLQKALVHSRIDHLIVHSPEAETSCKARLRLPEEKISLLRGGIDLEPYLAPQSGAAYREKLGLAPGCLLVGMVARMQERRDHFTLIRAMAQLGLSKEKVACLLIGDGEHRIPIESLIRDLKLEGQVFAPGYLGEDYLDALAAIEVFVYTAPGSDASCRAVMEALAMGKPVVGARRAAVPLLVEEGQTGYLFEPGNAEELASRIGTFLEHRERIGEFGDRGREFARRELSCSHLGQAVEAIYQALLLRK
jgi:glycosyltransferase involved in cell wall biosynthesis